VQHGAHFLKVDTSHLRKVSQGKEIPWAEVEKMFLDTIPILDREDDQLTFEDITGPGGENDDIDDVPSLVDLDSPRTAAEEEDDMPRSDGEDDYGRLDPDAANGSDADSEENRVGEAQQAARKSTKSTKSPSIGVSTKEMKMKAQQNKLLEENSKAMSLMTQQRGDMQKGTESKAKKPNATGLNRKVLRKKRWEQVLLGMAKKRMEVNYKKLDSKEQKEMDEAIEKEFKSFI